MEPISQAPPIPLSYSSPVDMVSGLSPVSMTVSIDNKTKMEYKPDQLASLLAASQQQQQQQPMTAVSSMPVVNGATAAMYRQALQQQPLTVYTNQQQTFPPQTNGQPLDGLKPPLLNHKLNGTEMAAVRQLITGYRESAAFLLRSADELEHLLQIQPKL